MGAATSNPVDAHTQQEIQDTIKACLGTFTTQYVKGSAIAMLIEAKKEAKKKPKPWKLLKRPKDSWKENYKTGWLVKEGAIVKNWKKRFFVVRPDYSVDYFEKEDDVKSSKPKPKGTMSLCGYWVNEDPNKGIYTRLKELAEKMGMNIDDLPKPKQYPKHTIELYHWKRRSWYIQCANEEEKQEWIEQFKTCCRRAYGLKNKEFVHEYAFRFAVRKTRWELGRWGWWSYGGTEEQILSDLVSDQIDYAVMSKIYGKIQGPWMIRQKIRESVMKSIDSAVSAAVTPAWKAMAAAVAEIRPKIEPTIKEKAIEIFKIEDELVEKMKEGAMTIINPILDEHVSPHLQKVLDIIKSPVRESYDICFELFLDRLNKHEFRGTPDEIKRNFWSLDWYPRSWDTYKACKPLDAMYDPLWALQAIFSDIYPWSLIWYAQDAIRGRMDDAFYTLEEKLMAALKEDATLGNSLDTMGPLIAKLKEEVMEDYKHDAAIHTNEFYCKIIKKIVFPPFSKLVIPACKTIIDPISDLVPGPFKDIIDPSKMFEDLIEGIIDESIKSVVGY